MHDTYFISNKNACKLRTASTFFQGCITSHLITLTNSPNHSFRKDVTKRGMGNGEWGMGKGKWGMGNGEWGMDNGEWGMGNGEWEMGNGKWGMGNGE